MTTLEKFIQNFQNIYFEFLFKQNKYNKSILNTEFEDLKFQYEKNLINEYTNIAKNVFNLSNTQINKIKTKPKNIYKKYSKYLYQISQHYPTFKASLDESKFRFLLNINTNKNVLIEFNIDSIVLSTKHNQKICRNLKDILGFLEKY